MADIAFKRMKKQVLFNFEIVFSSSILPGHLGLNYCRAIDLIVFKIGTIVNRTRPAYASVYKGLSAYRTWKSDSDRKPRF